MNWIRRIDRLITAGCFGIAVLCFAVIVYDLYDVKMMSIIFQGWAIAVVMLSAIRLALEWRMLSWRNRVAKLVFLAVLFAGVFVFLQMMGWL